MRFLQTFSTSAILPIPGEFLTTKAKHNIIKVLMALGTDYSFSVKEGCCVGTFFVMNLLPSAIEEDAIYHSNR